MATLHNNFAHAHTLNSDCCCWLFALLSILLLFILLLIIYCLRILIENSINALYTHYDRTTTNGGGGCGVCNRFAGVWVAHVAYRNRNRSPNNSQTHTKTHTNKFGIRSTLASTSTQFDNHRSTVQTRLNYLSVCQLLAGGRPCCMTLSCSLRAPVCVRGAFVWEIFCLSWQPVACAYCCVCVSEQDLQVSTK